MANKITGITKKELLQALKKRYKSSFKKDKTRILDEFCAITGLHRKHSIRLLSMGVKHDFEPAKHHRKIYNEAVRQALIVCWEAADRICGKRLKVILPEIVSAMKRHGHLQLDPEVRKLLLKASAATIDRNNAFSLYAEDCQSPIQVTGGEMDLMPQVSDFSWMELTPPEYGHYCGNSAGRRAI
jgi:hypothetical protein